ncbi:MAG: B12-binding domain-containing radical SAM protein [Acidobacteriota bacterium]
MKVLLIEPPRAFNPERCNDIANTPLASCLLSGYAAGMLASAGHDVEIVEGYLENLSYEAIRGIVVAARPDLLGVHMVYHWQTDRALFGFLGELKRDGLAHHVTAFGYYPTFHFEEILGACEAIDSVILGEPEAGFADLADALDRRGEPSTIKGLARRTESGKIAHSRRKPLEELDRLPFPVRTEAMLRLPEVNLQGSRGCYGQCTFCCINPFYAAPSRWRGRSPENIMAEIDSLIAEHGVRDFYFTDPNFFGPGKQGQDRAMRLASLIKERSIRFGIEGRVNDIHDETIGALVDAGLRHILIGLESGKDASLKRLNKMTTVAQNERAIAVLRKHGIEPNIGFIMFEPHSTLEDIRTNLEFLQRNRLLESLPITANVLYHHQIVLKGSPAFHVLREQGLLDFSSGEAYEGIAGFVDPKVAALADLMRRITNFLFLRMWSIWSGKEPEPAGARERYAKINRMLVDLFQNALGSLENGRPLSEEDRHIAVREAKDAVEQMLKG